MNPTLTPVQPTLRQALRAAAARRDSLPLRARALVIAGGAADFQAPTRP
jgi:hypothetical protein